MLNLRTTGLDQETFSVKGQAADVIRSVGHQVWWPRLSSAPRHSKKARDNTEHMAEAVF